MKLLLLASGTGSLAQAILDAGFEIASVVSDVPGAQVLDRAAAANIATKVIPFRKPREEWDQELINYIKDFEPDVMVKGSDYAGTKVLGEEYCKQIIFYDRLGKYSTTNKIKSIIDR